MKCNSPTIFCNLTESTVISIKLNEQQSLRTKNLHLNHVTKHIENNQSVIFNTLKLSEPHGYLMHAGVVQEGEQSSAVRSGGGLIIHHSNLDSPWISSNTQTDQRDLDDGQQELETQRAGSPQETVTVTYILPVDDGATQFNALTTAHPGILFIRSIVLMMSAAMFLPFGNTCLARTFQSAKCTNEKSLYDMVHDNSTHS